MHFEFTDEQVSALHYELGKLIGFLTRKTQVETAAGRPVPEGRHERLAALSSLESMLCEQSGLEPRRPVEPLAIDVIRQHVEDHPEASRREIADATKYAMKTVSKALKQIGHVPPQTVYQPPPGTARYEVARYREQHPNADKAEIARATGYALQTVANSVSRNRKAAREAGEALR